MAYASFEPPRPSISVTHAEPEVGLTAMELASGTATNRANSGDLETDLNELMEVPQGRRWRRTGPASRSASTRCKTPEQDTLAALVTAQHLAGQRQRAFYIIGAGLPNRPRALSEAGSYAERLFDYRTIGPWPRGKPSVP